MAITNHFYHSLTRKYISVFGSLFNKIAIKRYKDGVEVQSMPVPLSFGPWQKALARQKEDPNLTRKYQMLLPRMAFEMDGINYDVERKQNQLHKLNVSSENGHNFVYNPVPYNIGFTLTITTLNMEDGAQILEQILPFFQPSFVPSVYLIDGLDSSVDIPIDLESVSYEDAYDDNFEELRLVKWTLTFLMKAYYFGPTRTSSIIKFVDITNKNWIGKKYEESTNGSIITIQPGMDDDGNPTTDIDDTVNYISINKYDEWDFIKQIHTIDELIEKGYVEDAPNPHETNGKI